MPYSARELSFLLGPLSMAPGLNNLCLLPNRSKFRVWITHRAHSPDKLLGCPPALEERTLMHEQLRICPPQALAFH